MNAPSVSIPRVRLSDKAALGLSACHLPCCPLQHEIFISLKTPLAVCLSLFESDFWFESKRKGP